MKRYLLYMLLFLCGMCLSARDLNEKKFESAHDYVKTLSKSEQNQHGDDIVFDETFEDIQKQLREMRNRMNVDLPKIVLPVLGGILFLFMFLIVWLWRVCLELKRVKEKLERKLSESKEETDSKLQQLEENVQRLENNKGKTSKGWPMEKTVEGPRLVDPITDVRSAVEENRNKIVVYAELRNGNLETVSEQERRYYKITYEKGSYVGEFELVDDAPDMILRAIKSKEEYIDPVCETRGSARTAKNVRRIKLGKVRTNDGEIWKVDEKAIIEYES